MVKDWEYYKQLYLQQKIDETKRWFQLIESFLESPIERIAFMYLIKAANENFPPMALRIEEQFRVGPYKVDFMVIHRDTDTYIAIECDGHEFHEKTKEQAARDKKRDRYLAKKGIIVLRYTGSQICSNPMEIYNDVCQIILDRKYARSGRG